MLACCNAALIYLVHVMMDTARKHWEILQEIGTDLANKVRSFMVFDDEGKGDGVLVVTEDGQGFWFGKLRFGWGTDTNPTLLDVPGLVSMAHGLYHIILLNKRGEMYSMGHTDHGHADRETCLTPQLISIPHKFISVRCGDNHNLALTEDGKVWAWGSNNFGEVGLPISNELFISPHQISELDVHRVIAVECGGGGYSLALTDQGEVYSWGQNSDGQLGYQSESRKLSSFYAICQLTPTRIPTPSPIKSMAAGFDHTLLLTRTGEVYACGSNEWGQLGLPNDTKSTNRLTKVSGLPSISQIAAHHATCLSIAMSSDQRCFVWGELRHGNLEDKLYISISTPLKLPPKYSTVESPLSSFSTYRTTPHSVQVSEPSPNRLSVRMSGMFDNSDTSDVQFVVEQRTIHAHRNILSNSSDYFHRMFSERWLAPVDSEDSIVKVTISDHSYEAFHAFLRFLYTDCLEVHFVMLPKLFELASQYLESDLQQLCLERMRTTLTPVTCCLYYPLTCRHSLPELDAFQQDLLKFASIHSWTMFDTAAYKSMEPDLRDNLTNALENSSDTSSYSSDTSSYSSDTSSYSSE